MMADTSALCFFPFSSIPSVSRQWETNSLLFSSSKSSVSPPRSSRLLRFPAKASDSVNYSGDDSFNFFPWSRGESGIEWVQEERVTLFTADGLIQIGGSMVPRRITSTSDKKQGRSKTSQRFQRFQESNYMDPNQSLCLGALFDIAATNGLDMGRRLCILGFCRSIEMLSDVVEDTVLEHGGEVVVAEKATKGGLHEKLTMTVAVPYLWGVPPASETLHLAVQSGGGIVEKIYWQWDFL
ncbi:D-tagatose-1,6-bisphosphate aldolase subunit [Melia azedarach]|uniref:D-tagatose-1,6-bisphosphate aldolase subunit n=1 Tax=Melia azedarach TaxID=155640 RepID=A0ACC1X2W0_MELAZ|nr:D-tagatose-1,6-bisphosphate aldolase subunit [Melia azedarach]